MKHDEPSCWACDIPAHTDHDTPVDALECNQLQAHFRRLADAQVLTRWDFELMPVQGGVQ